MKSTPPLELSIHTGMGGSPALESKLLALELLLYILQNAKRYPTLFTNTNDSSTSDSKFSYATCHYLCVSLLKNCTSNLTQIVGLSLRLFLPIIRYFRRDLKTEIEVFVTNVFFVILDSRNSTVEHKSLVSTLFEEICADPVTLAKIFLNYNCDLSAVDLFHQIVNTLARVAQGRKGVGLLSGGGDENDYLMNEMEGAGVGGLVVGEGTHAKMMVLRQANRQLQLDAMGALKKVLESLHASIAPSLSNKNERTTNIST